MYLFLGPTTRRRWGVWGRLLHKTSHEEFVHRPAGLQVFLAGTQGEVFILQAPPCQVRRQ